MYVYIYIYIYIYRVKGLRVKGLTLGLTPNPEGLRNPDTVGVFTRAGRLASLRRLFIYLYTHTHTHTHIYIYIYIYIFYTYLFIYVYPHRPSCQSPTCNSRTTAASAGLASTSQSSAAPARSSGAVCGARPSRCSYPPESSPPGRSRWVKG